ncbi:type II CAAX endopeptidase family protein [Bacillus sp. FJAT-27251]|uniref:CPBP family intramembrane glutamic endopeptidase n=1 Tax=Bacillus sp. FJAT-27251 TaxID=1684142 RepID=UPI0006A7930D|nr:type II CAAX endopeptidase family protein [Bacillus sp. FJAT-27251]
MNKDKYSELVKGLTDRELLFHLYFTQILLLTISFILGIVLFDRMSDISTLFNWGDSRVWTVGLGGALFVVGMDLLLMKILPSRLYDDGGLNERIFRGRNLFHIAVIAAVVAFSEELLFRGVVQTHFGLVVSSLVFALVHYRYLFNWFLFLNIILLSFLIGYIYLVTGNLAVTVTMHFFIDFLLGIVIRFRNKQQTGRDVE